MHLQVVSLLSRFRERCLHPNEDCLDRASRMVCCQQQQQEQQEEDGSGGGGGGACGGGGSAPKRVITFSLYGRTQKYVLGACYISPTTPLSPSRIVFLCSLYVPCAPCTCFSMDCSAPHRSLLHSPSLYLNTSKLLAPRGMGGAELHSDAEEMGESDRFESDDSSVEEGGRSGGPSCISRRSRERGDRAEICSRFTLESGVGGGRGERRGERRGEHVGEEPRGELAGGGEVAAAAPTDLLDPLRRRCPSRRCVASIDVSSSGSCSTSVRGMAG